MEIWLNPACSKFRAATAALAALAADQRLVQRPIITADDGTTVVGRDAESLARVLPPA